uniref:Uncharacterized protein n=1 Tax=Arundo donax TaxID=35708 RepID=A0A0A9B5N8_ARUDO
MCILTVRPAVQCCNILVYIKS